MDKELLFFIDDSVERASCGAQLHKSVMENVFHRAVMPSFLGDLISEDDTRDCEIEINATTYRVENYCCHKEYICIGLSEIDCR